MQRMLELYRKVDNKIIDVAQDTYLWLWDRTGIYLATVATTFLLGWAALVMNSSPWFAVIIAGICGTSQGFRYLLQDKQQFEVLNRMAKVEREGTWRHLMMAVMYGFLLADVIFLDYMNFARSLLVVIYLVVIYMILHCVMLRKRDKKPLFEAAPKLAPEGAS